METTVSTEALNVRVGCTFEYQSDQAVPAIFVVRPATTATTRLLGESWSTNPATPYHDYADLYGNLCRRVQIGAGTWSMRYDVLVLTSPEPDPWQPEAGQVAVEDLPDDALVYTLPSRYCLSDAVADLAWELFGSVRPGWARVQAICDYVNGYITFGYGSSNVATTSSDVLANRNGVCRDFAHLAIAFARALNIPARYTFGYIPDIDVPPPYTPMDFCAWFEVYLDGGWWAFDARNNQRRRGRIPIARGRDALDVAMVTTYGNPYLKEMTVWADQVLP